MNLLLQKGIYMDLGVSLFHMFVSWKSMTASTFVTHAYLTTMTESQKSS